MITTSRALVTGAAGFIGSHVAERCLGLGFEVVAVDNLSGGYRSNVPAGATFIAGDVRDPALVSSLWEKHGPFDVVYHLAAYAAEGLSHQLRRFTYETNLLASANLINESIKGRVKHFVFTSSIAVYGANQLPMREDLTPRPEDPYGISKYAVELDLHAAAATYGLAYTIFRPHNVYGERQNLADPHRNVAGIFLRQALAGEARTIFGDGSQTRAFSHIDDVAPLIARAPLVPAARNQVFNIGADVPISVRELAREVASALGVPDLVRHLPARPEVVHAFADHGRARMVFQPPPAISLRDGLARMADWARKLGPVQPVSASGREIPLIPALGRAATP